MSLEHLGAETKENSVFLFQLYTLHLQYNRGVRYFHYGSRSCRHQFQLSNFTLRRLVCAWSVFLATNF